MGYTHCFFVAGGAIMHLLDSVRTRMICIPVVHEVAAGIAAEYFNEASEDGKAFALVTAGPGITNIITAMAGAFLESRELLVVAGQVKSTDLAGPTLRQRGIQEIDGLKLCESLTVASRRIEQPLPRSSIAAVIMRGRHLRPGPTLIEFCLDAQGAPVDAAALRDARSKVLEQEGEDARERAAVAAPNVIALTQAAQRPVWLIGGGVKRSVAANLLPALERTGVPLMTTWNGADRIPRTFSTYIGRPNTWGQRSANVLLRQSDLVVAFGTRLGIQQTGFNWQEFARDAKIVQIEIDEAELKKGHPHIDVPICGDANELLRLACEEQYPSYASWLDFCHEVRRIIPLNDPANQTAPGFVNPFQFYLDLSTLTTSNDIVIPCSSGGANSTGMQAFEPLSGQIIITNKGLASMGYGLAGAIGAAFSNRNRRVTLIEGDGGFIQNLQELATVGVGFLNLKIFIFANNGYASIRTTQRNYFGGAYLGCDTATGLGFPSWAKLFDAFNIPYHSLASDWMHDSEFLKAYNEPGPSAFIVPVDPEQTYFPKVTSRVTASGTMESNPIHLMSPELPENIAGKVFRYLPILK